MGDDEWKQSAVMFYACGTIITMLSFVFCCVYSLYKNSERKRRIQSIVCCCCHHDPMTQYDTIHTRDDDDEVTTEMIPTTENVFSIDDDASDDEEIEIDIHGDESPPLKTLASLNNIDAAL